MESFTPVSAIVGGGLIGLSAFILMLFNGRIAGISGVLAGAAFGAEGDRSWRISFLAGLIGAPLLVGLITAELPRFEMNASWPFILAGGLLVGFGTRLGSGCTSGHGVCGLSRLSRRSLVAVTIFMLSGMIVVAGVKLVLGN
jgi:uncharacterized membrane protein YedE/YeeE